MIWNLREESRVQTCGLRSGHLRHTIPGAESCQRSHQDHSTHPPLESPGPLSSSMRAKRRMWVVAGDGPSQAHVVLSPTCHQEKINRAMGTGPESIAKPEMRPERGGDEWAWLQVPRYPQALWGRGLAFLEEPAVICRETSESGLTWES